MPVRTRKKISVSIMTPFLVVILFFSIMAWKKYRASREVPPIPTQQQSEGGRSVTLYFAADGTRLAREAREIDACDTDTDCIKSVLDELLNGPVGEFDETLPEGTAVDSIRIEGNLAIVEFNRTFSEAMPSGSSAEMMAVYSVVNTIAANFPQVQKVKLNSAGSSGSILHHLDLSEPLPPDFSLEQGGVTVIPGKGGPR